MRVCNECGSKLPDNYCHEFGSIYDGNSMFVCLWCIKKAAHFIALKVEEQAPSTPQENLLTDA